MAPLPDDSYPNDPQHSNFITPNWYYPDGSNHQYDANPRYVLNEWTDEIYNGIYDVPRNPRMPTYEQQGDPAGKWNLRYRYSGWTNWVDKWSKDVRFSSQSDTNATATLFPEVYDPWMFTEYLYQGNSQINDLDPYGQISPSGEFDPFSDGPVQIDPVQIVEPPLVNPVAMFERSFGISGDDSPSPITESTIELINDQVATTIGHQDSVAYELEWKWKSDSTDAEYWESDLRAMYWEEENGNRDFTRLNEQRRIVQYAVPLLNSGVKLYRHPVWAQSTRWGQAQNIPERVVNLTGPKSFFKPDGKFTGRIVPRIKITWGMPLYDPIVDGSGVVTYAAKYENYGSTASGLIGLFPRPLSGGSGDPSEIYIYDLVPDNFTGALQVQMPRDNVASILNWNSPNYSDNELVHHGCEFFRGENGQARCTYYTENINALANHWKGDLQFSDPDTDFTGFTIPPFSTDHYEWMIYWWDATSEVHSVNKKSSDGDAASYEIRNEAGLVTNLVIRLNGVDVRPASSDLINSPTLPVTVQVVVRRKNAPYPHPKLCAFYEAQPEGNTTNDYTRKRYATEGGKCQYYTPKGRQTMGSYSAEAANGAEWANMQRGLPPGYKKGVAETAYGQTAMQMVGLGPIGGGFGAMMGVQGMFSALALGPDPYTNGSTKEDNSRIEVEFVPEVVSLTGKTQYYDTPTGKPRSKDPDQDVKINASTSLWTLDEHETTTFDGVDTTFFGMVSQHNYRITKSVQHCFRSDKCTPIINSPNGNIGWRRGWFGGVNFENHPLRMPGYPAGNGDGGNGNIKHCFTGNSRCPYNNVDRRAVEYDENYKVLVNEILHPFRFGGISAFSAFGIEECFIQPDGQFISGMTPEEFESTLDGKSMCVGALRHTPNDAAAIIGHWQPVVTDQDGQDWRIYFYYEKPSWDIGHKTGAVMAHIVQFNDNDQPAYMVAPWEESDPKYIAWETLFTDADTVPWLVLLQEGHRSPHGNLLYPTNSKAFAGGRPPEYKDRSKLKNEIMVYRGGYSDRSFREGATDTNQFGGPMWNRAPVAGRVRMGYWIDKDGEWILDGRQIGYGEGFVEVRPRMRSKPSVQGKRYPVHGEPGMSINDTENPEFNRSSEYASVGWTYSNDTKAYIEYLQDRWEDELPIDPATGEPVHIVPPNPNVDMLPRERFWYQCEKCGIDFPEEEINYLKNLSADAEGTPLYPIPEGAGEGAVCGCPRHDGGAVVLRGAYTRFMKCYARGHVDVWAPPGSTVRHDAYFWKNPTLVSRAHKDQLLRKLGGFNPRGGGYDFTTLANNVEHLGRLPATTNRKYQPGISRGLVAPWAAPGETVTAIRARVGDKFGLLDTDHAYISRIGESDLIQVEDESTFIMQLDDVLMWWRNDLDEEPWRVGLGVSASASLPDAIKLSSLVTNDESMPIRSDFDNNDIGQKRYETALRNWLIGVVYASMQHYSSSLYAQINAWKSVLISQGLDGGAADSFDPVDGTVELDERVIDPYGKTQDGGLKMITIREMKRLRNRVLPAMAYDITAPTYTGGGDFEDRAQHSHLNRFQETRKPLTTPKYGVIDPQVLAANETGKDNWAEWEIGDIENNHARAFYPTGTTWWRLNQLVGSIKRNGGTNYFHMDDSQGGPLWETWDHLMTYSGDNIKSTVMYFLHGRIPMDKEILGAFLIFTPQDAPSMDAIGCQGQYTGNVGGIDPVNGGVIGADYRGHQQCFWMHYHGYTTNHELDAPYPYHTLRAKNHVELGHSNPPWFRDQGTQNDPSMPQLLGDFNQYGSVVELQEIGSEFEYQPFIFGGSTALYDDHIKIIGMKYEDKQRGFGVTQSWIKPWNWGEDLFLLVTENQIWKELTYSQYSMLKDRYHVNWRASVNRNESVLTGEYYAGYFRSQIWAKQHQAIPGWLNFGGYDSSGRFSRNINEEEKTFDADWANGPQVILQADQPTGGASASGGGNIVGGGGGSQQAGSVNKVMDITSMVKRLYNDRVPRFYKAVLGARFNDLFDLVAAQTDTNEGFVSRFHQEYQDPWFFWNYRYMHRAGGTKYGMWLNDPWHHTPLSSDMPVIVGDQGDPLEQSDTDRKERIAEVSDWDKQDLLVDDDNYKQYHPFSLLSTDIELSDDLPPYGNTDGLVTPRPESVEDRYWRVYDSQPFSHYFVSDLRQTPYENLRRNWRYNAPRVDSSPATCPNIDCWVHIKNWTVGQLLENSLAGWGGYGVMPSTTSPLCANCRTPLEGVLYLDGDNILTTYYDKSPVDDAIITGLEVDVVSAIDDTAARHGFLIEYFNSTVQQWRTLFSVNWDANTSRWKYRTWENGGWIIKSSITLPTIFKGVEGANGAPKDSNEAEGAHFIAIPACKVRFRVVKPAILNKMEPVDGSWVTLTSTDHINAIVVFPSISGDIAKYRNRSVTIRKTSGMTTEERTFLINEIKDETSTGGGFKVTLSGIFDEGFTEAKIHWKEYLTRCTKFRVYGYPYREGEVIITPPAFSQPIMMIEGNNEFRLNNWPSQICQVTCMAGEGDEVIMTESETNDPDQDFFWTVVNDTFDGITYQRIVGGKWYYDSSRNIIVTPVYYLDPEDDTLKGIWNLNLDLYQNENNTFNLKTLPSLIYVEFIVSNGVSVDVKVTACGAGPSYQLEPECVTVIKNHSNDDTDAAPEGFESESLPDRGESVRLKLKNNERVPLKWMVYNHEPIIWKNSVAWVVGDEALPAGWGDGIYDVFTGNGRRISEIKPNNGARIGGLATGKVTLYGSPNTILSGNLLVYAKAYTKRTYNITGEDGSPTTIQFEERTGGYREGAFIFNLEITDKVVNRRTGITCGVPQVLIYLRERYEDEEKAGK